MRRSIFLGVTASLLLPALAAAAPTLSVTLDAPGWAAWRVYVPPTASVTFTTTFEGGAGLRGEGGAVLKGPGSGGLAYAAVDRALPQGFTLRVAGADLVGRPPGGALADGAHGVTLACASTCASGEVVIVRYAAGDFRRATLGVDLAGATLLTDARGAGAYALREATFGVLGSDPAALHAHDFQGVPVGAFFAEGDATLRMAGPRGVEACACVLVDEARGPGRYGFAAQGPGEAFLVAADVSLPPR
jgi:hypothetical protein